MRIGDEIVLRHGPYSARVAPEAGARLTSLAWDDGMRRVDLIVPWQGHDSFDPWHWPKAGAFAMAPFSNRLGNARFSWEGREIALPPPPGESHALHGFAHRAAWQVVATTPRSATLHFRHAGDTEGWPWPFTLRMQVTLDDRGAGVTLTFTSESADEAPAGLGWHPFHPAPGPMGDDAAFLQLAAERPRDVGHDGLAILAPATSPAPARRFLLGSADLQPQTTVFEHWDGMLTVPLGDAGTLDIETTGARHLLLHVPPGATHICLEPVTLLPGALHTHDAAQARQWIALAPGESRSLAWRCSLLPAH